MKKLIIQIMLSLLACTSWGLSDFTDQDLMELLNQSQVGIIYLWSPLMPLSSMGREEIINVARELDASLTLIADPFAHDIGVTDPVLASRKLMDLGMMDHYPAIALYKNGHLMEDALVLGYEPAKTLKPLLKSLLEKEDR